MRSTALCGAVCAVLVISCSDEETGPNISGVPAINITRVQVVPTLDTMLVADTVRATDRLQMSATVFGRTGAPISGARVAWSSSDVSVATVTETGLVIPTGFGTTTISASATKVAKATIVVVPATRAIQITPTSDSIFVENPIITTRDTVRLRAVAFDDSGRVVTGIRFSWTSSVTGVATVDGTGLINARTLGVTTITVQSGDRTRTATVRVAPVVKSIVVTSPVSRLLARDTVQLSAVALGYDDKPMVGRIFKWSSSNLTVARVDSLTGRAIFLQSGQATFTAQSSQTTNASTVTALERQLLTISSGDDFTCGVANLGRGYCWGVGDLGQLATAADSTCFDASDLPVRGVPGVAYQCTLSPKRNAGPELDFAVVDAGESSACGITTQRLIYCWGDDTHGQIGNGLKGAEAQPSLATVAQERFDSITVGGAHACALNTARQAYCWGKDLAGQLGDNRLVNSTTPIPVIGGLTFTSISAGSNHTCGISNNQAYCWGANESGQLGNGAAGVNSSIPVLVAGGHSFAAVSAGRAHTCAVTSAGEVMCWGADDAGQIGGGGPRSIPVSAAAGTFTRISAGAHHTCALASSGTVSCWGSNVWGQLGNGSVAPVSSLGLVSGQLSFRSISAGSEHTCGVTTNGDTYCWGSNVFGTLGNELQAAYRATPQRVATPR